MVCLRSIVQKLEHKRTGQKSSIIGKGPIQARLIAFQQNWLCIDNSKTPDYLLCAKEAGYMRY